MGTAILIVWGMIILWAGLSFYRLNRFSKFMHKEIDNAFEARIHGRSAHYPDVSASYNNLKWYDMFNFNFKSLMVYDTTR